MTTLVDKFKSDIPVITNDFKKFAESIGKVTQDDIANGWVSYAKSIGNTDKELLRFLGNVDAKKANIEDIDKYTQSASTSTSKFGAALKSAAANIGIMLAINVGIWAVGKAWDYFVNRVENLKKAAEESAQKYSNLESEISSINSELESTGKRIDELNKKEHLTFIEQDELQKLKDTNEELERQLKNQEALANVAKQDANEKAKEYFDSPGSGYRYGGWDMSQVEAGNTRYGQPIPDVYVGTQLEVAKQQLVDYENLLQQKADIEKRLSDFQSANPSDYANSDEYQNIILESNEINNALNILKDALSDSITEFDKFDDNLNLENDKLYIDALKEISDSYQKLFGVGKTATQSFDDIWNADTFSRARKELESMALAGTLSPSILNNSETYNRLLKETGKTAEEICENIYALVEAEGKTGQGSSFLSYSNTIAELDKMSDAFSALDSAYVNFIDNDKEITFDNLSALSEKFKDLSGISLYIKAIHDAKGNTEATQQAFDNLTSVYIEHTGILDQVNQSNASLIQSYLQEQGIVNAEILVQESLAHNLAVVEAQKYLTANASFDLANATSDEIASLINSAEAADVSKAALVELMMAKISCNETGVITDGDIQNLIDLATAAGIAEAAIKNAKKAQGQKNTPGITRSAGAENAINESIYGNLEDEIKAELYKPREYKFTGGSASNKARSGGSGGSKGSKGKEATEFDWMEQKITLLDSRVDKLKSNIESLVGYKNKNSMTHTTIDVLTEKMEVLQQMSDKYMERASGLGLSQEYIDKIHNGTIEIETIGDENLAKLIQEYQNLFNKAQDANKRIFETNEVIHDLNLSKLDNIIGQFEQVMDIQSQMIDTEKQLLDLREKSGEVIYADDYLSLAGKQLKLTHQNADAYNALAAEMAKLNLKEGSDDWKKYNDQLQEYKNNMISAADVVEQYKDAMTELAYKGLGDFKNELDAINGTIRTMNDLIGDTNLIDEFGNLTDRGLAQIALYTHQMSNAKQEAAEYSEAIKSLDDALDSGLINQDEYNSMLQEYTSAQESAVKSSKDARDAILSLVKEGIQAEIDAKRKLIDETKAALDAEKDLHDYQKSITEKQDNISRLQRAIASINSTDRDSLRQKLELQNELNKAMEDLNELQYDHEIESRKEALDDEYNSFEESKQKESDELDSNLDAQNAAINKYLEQVKSNYSTVYGILTQYGDEYSLSAIEDLTDPWTSSSDAADLCASTVGDAIANIQYEINGLDFSPLYELADLLNQIGLGKYGAGTSSVEYEDITGTGKWQKGQGGKWWFGEDYDSSGSYDYASGDIYTINGKQYGFDGDGYMVTGWRDDFGDLRYFEPENGEMVKSQWRKDQGGEWYYLDKDGVMATDMAVKARDNEGYYYLDENGKWDGETLTNEQIKKLGYTIGYKRGTISARKGWNLMDEDGVGSEAFITDKGILKQFKGGESVFNPDMTNNLWDFAQDPTQFISGLDGIHNTLDFSKVKPVHNISIDAPLVQIDGTGLSATEVAAIIKNETRDIDKRVAKSIRYELLGK